jgi:predicted nucleotidyltransferase
MRLKQIEAETIRSAILELDPSAQIYLFGSRVDDNAKGGDIDILVLSRQLRFKDKLIIKSNIFKKIEEQKIDILITQDTDDPFVKIVKRKSVRL